MSKLTDLIQKEGPVLVPILLGQLGVAGVRLAPGDFTGWEHAVCSTILIVVSLLHRFSFVSDTTAKDINKAADDVVHDYMTRDGKEDGGRRK